MIDLPQSLNHPLWQAHNLGDSYTMDGKPEQWKIAYYPLFGTYQQGKWFEFKEPRALIEKPMSNGGTDFKEMPLKYLKRETR